MREKIHTLRKKPNSMTDKDFKTYIESFFGKMEEINDSIVEMEKSNLIEFSKLKIAQEKIIGSVNLNVERCRSMMDGKIEVSEKKCFARHMKLIYFLLSTFVLIGLYLAKTSK